MIYRDARSNFIEVENIQKGTTHGVSKALKIMFAMYGVPNELVTDNGPQFSSAEFTTFAQSWGLNHITSSPHYPQSNGKAENAVKTVKRLFRKCQESRESEYLALLTGATHHQKGWEPVQHNDSWDAAAPSGPNHMECWFMY